MARGSSSCVVLCSGMAWAAVQQAKSGVLGPNQLAGVSRDRPVLALKDKPWRALPQLTA
ncbi:exported hypothetical protein [Nostocoides jenkinsii Ben 74]|uniref:Uncharacterized protein n=1 Tax=Nostocoides jenkinsii Ben 74 TaxID=1193518 RepID=A0A077M802_9MICO|nr:exported hypothetical protein [Tetrasphaera jenkinsii Ben 74]